jgi:hypothetical protein
LSVVGIRGRVDGQVIATTFAVEKDHVTSRLVTHFKVQLELEDDIKKGRDCSLPSHHLASDGGLPVYIGASMGRTSQAPPLRHVFSAG